MDIHPYPRKKPHPNVMPTMQHITWRASVVTSRAMSLLMFVSILLQPAAAVLLTNWQNCLDDSIKYSDPRELQWSPLYVGAQFEHGEIARTLRVTVWGNVSGSYGGTSLPAWNSAEWDDANFTDGKIVHNPFPTTAARLTTLHDRIDVLTYEPYSADFDFCEDALTNRTCPLGPVFNTTAVYVLLSSSSKIPQDPLLAAVQGLLFALYARCYTMLYNILATRFPKLRLSQLSVKRLISIWHLQGWRAAVRSWQLNRRHPYRCTFCSLNVELS